MKHAETHPGLDVDGCFGCKAASINLAPSATPSRTGGAELLATIATSKQRDRDLPAYKRLRQDGLRPRSTAGAADLERDASCEEHVTTGMTQVKPSSFANFESHFGHKATDPVT